MGVGADGGEVAVFGDQAVGGAGEFVAQAFGHCLYAPVLPEVAMPAPSAEVRDFEALDGAQGFDLFPDFGFGAGVEDFKLEPAHCGEDRATAEFHQDREGGDFPQHDFGP